jgi:hypothetical protein
MGFNSAFKGLMSVRLSAWNNSALTERIFIKFLYLSIFQHSVEKMKFPWKSEKNNGYFTWSPIYISMNVSPSLLSVRNVSDNSYRENQGANWRSITFLLPKIKSYGKIWKTQTGYKWQYNRAYALCMPHTQGYKNVFRIRNDFSFPRQRWLLQRVWMLRLSVICLSW